MHRLASPLQEDCGVASASARLPLREFSPCDEVSTGMKTEIFGQPGAVLNGVDTRLRSRRDGVNTMGVNSDRKPDASEAFMPSRRPPEGIPHRGLPWVGAPW